MYLKMLGAIVVALSLAGCGMGVPGPTVGAPGMASAASTEIGCAGAVDPVARALCDQKSQLDRHGAALERIETSVSNLEKGAGQLVVFEASRRNAFGSCAGPIDSLSCIRRANALCRERGFANGRVADSEAGSMVIINSIACIRPRF